MLSNEYSNNKTSGIKLVSLYSTIKMMHGPINIKCVELFVCLFTGTSLLNKSHRSSRNGTAVQKIPECVSLCEFMASGENI